MAIAEGRILDYDGEDKINSELLELFDFNSPTQKIITTNKEFSAVCPFSGLPDTAEVIIEYFPIKNKCIELKSLKYYFLTFRNVGIYQEAVTKRMYDDLSSLVGTKIKITTIYNVRGGFYTTCIEGEL